jgi:hypothetical protein
MYNANTASFGFESSSRTMSSFPEFISLEPIINVHFVYKPVSQSFDLDLSSGTINAEKQVIKMPEKKSWDETMEEVLLDHAEAWEKLADV